MKKFITVFVLGILFVTATIAVNPVRSQTSNWVNAQMPAPNGTAGSRLGMQQGVVEGDHTAREEAEGKAVWEKLQAKQVNCLDLSEEDFGALGEYFMGQMAGEQHEAMNNMMIQMVGEEGEKQMHIAMGKRMSNCEPNAPMPQTMMNNGMMPMMMNMMMGGGMMGDSNSMVGGWSSPFGFNQANNPMMNSGYSPFGWLGWLFMVLLWVLVVVGIIALIRWLLTQIKGGTEEKSALTILKERYAKGEIDKKEFEEKKKDLS